MSTRSSKESKFKVKSHVQDSISSFIRKTYDILEERKFPDIIDWNPEGTALVIKKPTEFCQKVLPAYFKHNNLTSFVRQLNMYNFHKRRTQNIDHVYYHELFQKSKKHLLKEIRRKSQNNFNDHSAEKNVKVEHSETSQSENTSSSLAYENQALKRMYNDAMNKLHVLESKVKELSAENQSLWNQLYFQRENEGENFNSTQHHLALARKQSSLTQDQLPMTFSGINIPPLKINAPYASVSFSSAKGHPGARYEEMGESTTETSRGSPSTRHQNDSDKIYDAQEAALLQQHQHLSLTPQVSQIQALKAYNDLGISRQEMSVGQIFEAWNAENQNAMEVEKMSLLGKRQLDLGENHGGEAFQVPEPPTKRHELSIFNRRSIVSTGLEDLRMMLRRDSSIGEEFDHNAGVDLMDFNNPFCAQVKNT